jgi:Caspase domain
MIFWYPMKPFDFESEFEMPILHVRFWLALSLYSAVVVASLGCATDEAPKAQALADPSFHGAIAWGEVRGERAPQVQSAIESGAIKIFPNAQWVVGQSDRADVALDLQVFAARTQDVSSTQEQRNCRRWSDPDRDAKGLQKLLSRQCLDWQVQQLPCLTRTYEADAQIRARLTSTQRLIASDRKVVQTSERRCGGDRPSTAQLQAQAESQLALWAIGIMRDPLAQWAKARIVSTPAAPSQQVAPPTSLPVASFRPSPLPFAAAPAPASIQAHALIIGNANYPGSARLANPINDALSMERKLSELGFSVTRILDGDRETLIRGLSQFQSVAKDSQVTLLFYSGHGMQIDGINYLVPVNLDLNRGASLKLQGIAMDTIIESYLPGTTKLIFLDACRDNPAVTTGLRGFSRGLAPIQAPTGTLIAYATRDGGVAEDGSGQHSPYTQALLDVIDQPEDISLLLRRVRDRVMRETSGRQQPWEYGSLSGGELILSRLRRGQP